MVQILRIRFLIWSTASYLQHCVCFQEKRINIFFLWSVESYIHYRKFVVSSRNGFRIRIRPDRPASDSDPDSDLAVT
jgi:hypothetical protein